jgi:hypothetical protein
VENQSQSGFSILGNLVTFIGTVVQFFAGLFGLTLSSGEAQAIGAFLVVLFVAWAVRQIYWSIANAASFRPQIIALPTKLTPWDVVWNDASSCLLRILAVVLILFVVILLAQACNS